MILRVSFTLQPLNLDLLTERGIASTDSSKSFVELKLIKEVEKKNWGYLWRESIYYNQDIETHYFHIGFLHRYHSISITHKIYIN